LLFILARLGYCLFFLIVIVLVEVVNVLLCLLDRLGFLGSELFGSLRVAGIALLAPLLNDLGLLLFLCIGTIARVIVY
jgi:hypothetical protein